jgi:hypothetical protein
MRKLALDGLTRRIDMCEDGGNMATAKRAKHA